MEVEEEGKMFRMALVGAAFAEMFGWILNDAEAFLSSACLELSFVFVLFDGKPRAI